MSDVPEDRGPSSLRIVNYDPKNAVHSGLVSRQHPKSGAPVNANIEARTDRIVMPVAPGMEQEPKLSGRHTTNEEHAGYTVPEEHRINSAEEAKKLPQSLKDKAAAPKKKAAPKKPMLQTESQRAVSKEELRRAADARRNAALRKK